MKYVYGLGLAYAVDGSGRLQVYHTDGLGLVRAITDGPGNVLATYKTDAFGVPLKTTGNSSQPLRFTGQQLDAESGLYDLRARMYDPAIARFMQAVRISRLMGPAEVREFCRPQATAHSVLPMAMQQLNLPARAYPSPAKNAAMTSGGRRRGRPSGPTQTHSLNAWTISAPSRTRTIVVRRDRGQAVVDLVPLDDPVPAEVAPARLFETEAPGVFDRRFFDIVQINRVVHVAEGVHLVMAYPHPKGISASVFQVRYQPLRQNTEYRIQNTGARIQKTGEEAGRESRFPFWILTPGFLPTNCLSVPAARFHPIRRR